MSLTMITLMVVFVALMTHFALGIAVWLDLLLDAVRRGGRGDLQDRYSSLWKFLWDFFRWPMVIGDLVPEPRPKSGREVARRLGRTCPPDNAEDRLAAATGQSTFPPSGGPDSGPLPMEHPIEMRLALDREPTAEFIEELLEWIEKHNHAAFLTYDVAGRPRGVTSRWSTTAWDRIRQ